MRRDIPLEFAVSVTVRIVLMNCPITANNLSVIFYTKQAETISHRSECLPGEIRSEAEPANITLH